MVITREQAQKLNLKSDNESLLLIENALAWISANTTITVDTEHLEDVQASVCLFVSKYQEIMSLPFGISSESAGGLSQSFKSADRNDMLLELASSVFGDENVTTGKVKFVSAQSRWR